MSETENNPFTEEPEITPEADAEVAIESEEAPPAPPPLSGIIWATGRRKSSVARVRLRAGEVDRMSPTERKLTVILAADNVGFGKFMGDDETTEADLDDAAEKAVA